MRELTYAFLTFLLVASRISGLCIFFQGFTRWCIVGVGIFEGLFASVEGCWIEWIVIDDAVTFSISLLCSKCMG